jgi:preprotein translocase subunit Sec61beta
MASITTIFQSDLVSNIILPLFLVFFIVFAVLEKIKLFGADKKQVHAFIALVISLIFVGATYKLMVNKLIFFLVVALVAVFAIVLLWGFIFHDEKGIQLEPWMKAVLGIGLGVAFLFALIWIASDWWDGIIRFFQTDTGKMIITNVLFVLTIAVALVVVLGGKKEKN